MRKLLLIAVALFVALVISEVIVKYVIGFPSFGVDSYVQGLDSRGFDKCRVYQPHSKYYTTEGGFKVYKRNNIGLIGSDFTQGIKNLYLLGSSYVEAKEVPPGKTASSLLNAKCLKHGIQVLNIGYRGCTPYEQYTRLHYYSQKFKNDLAVLVLDSTYDHWYKERNTTIVKAEDIASFGSVDKHFYHNAYRIARNSLAIANLLIPSLTSREAPENETTGQVVKQSQDIEQGDIQKLLDSIKLIKEECPQLMVISFIDEVNSAKMVGNEMQNMGIPYLHINLKQEEYLTYGKGHLNEKGNAMLAGHIYNSLLQTGYLRENDAENQATGEFKGARAGMIYPTTASLQVTSSEKQARYE